jgi:hypothetical protein
LLRATAAIRIAAIGRTIALGPDDDGLPSVGSLSDARLAFSD